MDKQIKAMELAIAAAGKKEGDIPQEKKEKKKFRYKGTCFMLTYKDWKHKQALIEFINTKLKGRIKKTWVAHETGDEENPYNHTHILVLTKASIDISSERLFDIPGELGMIHPHFRPWNAKELRNGWWYLTKEDLNLRKELMEKEGYNREEDEKSFCEKVWDCKNMKEAMIKHVEKAADAPGVKLIFNIKQGRKVDVIEPTYKCQQDLLRKVEGKADDRKIIWYWEKNGSVGKCIFTKWLMAKFPEDWYAIAGCSNIYHLSTIVAGAFEKGWNGKGIIINLTRAAEHSEGLYACLESLKDGLMTCSKYVGHTMLFNSPWVIVFSNWEPKYEKLSMDRWDVTNKFDMTQMKKSNVEKVAVGLPSEAGLNNIILNKAPLPTQERIPTEEEFWLNYDPPKRDPWVESLGETLAKLAKLPPRRED